MPADYEPLTARLVLPAPAPDEPIAPFLGRGGRRQDGPQFLVLGNMGGYIDLGADGVPNFDSAAAHAAEIGSAGEITNARGPAGMYAPLANGGVLDGIEFVNPETLARMGTVSSADGRLDQIGSVFGTACICPKPRLATRDLVAVSGWPIPTRGCRSVIR